MSDSPKDRVLAAINHESVDRIPTDYWGTAEVTEMLCHHLGCDTQEDMYDRLGVDGIMRLNPPYIGPPLPEKLDGGSAYARQAWGMRLKPQPHVSGGTYWAPIYHPLAAAETIQDLDGYQWPDPDWYDYDALAGECARYPHRAISVGYFGVFFYHNALRGFEQSLLDLAAYPEFTHHLLQKLTDTLYEYHARCFEATRGLAQMTEVTDDFGTQKGLMISEETYAEFFRPHMKRGVELAKSYDLFVFHHDDGAILPLLPDLVELGIDVLNPVQCHLPGMDPAGLKDSFGEQICFHGGVDTQDVMPYGTPDEVRAEVAHMLGTLGRDGTGYVLTSSSRLQPDTPVENILAMYGAARELG